MQQVFVNSVTRLQERWRQNDRHYSAKAWRAWSFFDTMLSPRMHLTALVPELLGGEYSDFEKGCRCQRCHTSLHGWTQGTGTFWVPRWPRRRDPITVFSDTLPQKVLRRAPEGTRDKTAPVKSEPAGLCCVFTAGKAGEVSRSNFSLLHANWGSHYHSHMYLSERRFVKCHNVFVQRL